METTVLNPQVVYVQATTPSDKTEGKLWYNTTNNTLYSSDGSSYLAMETDTSSIQKLIQENALNILVNSAGASTTLNDWDDMFIDRFTDANGQLNTIDTGNTTAVFDTDHYINSENSNVVESASEYSTSNSGNVNTYKNMKTLNCSNTICNKVFFRMKGDLSSSTGNYRVTINYQDATNDQVIATWDLGAGNTYHAHEVEIPQAKAVDNVVIAMSCINANTQYTDQAKVTSLTIEDRIVQTNAQTINSGVKHVQIYSNHSTAGTGSITANISLDNGSTWTTDIPLNEKTPITSTNGTQLIMKLNLNAGASAGLATASDYAIMLFY